MAFGCRGLGSMIKRLLSCRESQGDGSGFLVLLGIRLDQPHRKPLQFALLVRDV